MAEIPVTKKSSSSWLWWLLLLLGILALVWFLLSNGDDEDDVALDDDTQVAQVEQATPAVAVAGALTVGETVDLDNVRVTELAGDMAFMIDNNGEPAMVLFDETQTPGDATEGEYDINVGSMLNLDGEVRSASDPLPEGVNATLPAGTETYIYATAIEMVS